MRDFENNPGGTEQPGAQPTPAQEGQTPAPGAEAPATAQEFFNQPVPQPPVPPVPPGYGAATPPPPYGTPQPAAPHVKTRRVGTITMALSLIAVGALMLLRIVVPSLNFITIAQFAPMVLVFLGIEILLFNFFNKDAKLKYDFLSIFMAILLIGFSLFASIVPPWLQRRTQGDQLNRRMSQVLIDQAYETLQGTGISSLDGYVSVNQATIDMGMGLDELAAEDYVQVRVSFPGGFDSAEAFAETCRQTLNRLEGLAPHFDYISMYSWDDNLQQEIPDGQVRYSLTLANRFQQSWTAAEMKNQLYVEYWMEDRGYFANEAQYQDYLEMMRQNPEEPDDADATSGSLPVEGSPANSTGSASASVAPTADSTAPEAGSNPEDAASSSSLPAAA